MLNYVNRVFVGKASGAASTAQTVGQPLTLSGLTVGDIYVLDQDGIVLDAAAAASASVIRVARATSATKVALSSDIIKTAIFKPHGYTYQAYSAPVNQVTNFADLGLQAGRVYQLQVVIFQDLALIANRQDRITVVQRTATGGNFSIATELAKLVSNFNKQRVPLGIITASVNGTTGITLTGKTIPTQGIDDYEFVNFTANFVDVTDSLNPVAIQPSSETKAQGGSGVAVQVRQMERVANGMFGATDPRSVWYRPTIQYGAVDGTGYDIYRIHELIRHEGMLQDMRHSPVMTTVALATGSTQQGAIGAILDAFVAGTATTPPQGE